jgi:hypothetical protein
MNLTEIAKRTYRKRTPAQRPGRTFVVFDKRQEKYYKTFMAGEYWKDRPEEANLYESLEKAHGSLESLLNRTMPSEKDIWPQYQAEIGLSNEQIDWHHIADYFEIHEIALTSRVTRKIEVGTD